MGKLKGLQIRPGMAVQVFVRTGERSLLNYLFKPCSTAPTWRWRRTDR